MLTTSNQWLTLNLTKPSLHLFTHQWDLFAVANFSLRSVLLSYQRDKREENKQHFCSAHEVSRCFLRAVYWGVFHFHFLGEHVAGFDFRFDRVHKESVTGKTRITRCSVINDFGIFTRKKADIFRIVRIWVTTDFRKKCSAWKRIT